MTQKTKAQLATDLAANLPSNTTGAITPTVMRTHLTDMTDSLVVETAYDANSVLVADSDNTPVVRTVAEQTLVGRITGGNIDDLSVAQVQALLKSPVPLFDHFTSVGNVGAGEDDLYSDTIAAGQLANNGDKLHVRYSDEFLAHATATRQNKIYFGGTAFIDTTAQSWPDGLTQDFDITIYRVSASVVRWAGVVARMTGLGVGTLLCANGEITGLTLANTNILKITGEAAGVGAETNDVLVKSGAVVYIPAA